MAGFRVASSELATLNPPGQKTQALLVKAKRAVDVAIWEGEENAPPAQPRDDKSLCDNVRIFRRDEALRLLQAGVERGMISEWGGSPLEARLENPGNGTYHGIHVGDHSLTRLEDSWATTIRTRMNGNAYTLARWFAVKAPPPEINAMILPR